LVALVDAHVVVISTPIESDVVSSRGGADRVTGRWNCQCRWHLHRRRSQHSDRSGNTITATCATSLRPAMSFVFTNKGRRKRA
jgi:hypothetical protein